MLIILQFQPGENLRNHGKITFLLLFLLIININTSVTDCHASVTLHMGAAMLCHQPFH